MTEASTRRPSFVVTGGAQGVGRAVAERLAAEGTVVVLDVVDALDWHDDRVHLVSGDASDPEGAGRAATAAEASGPLLGWVNCAAVFRDADFTSATATEVLDLVLAKPRAGRHGLPHGGPALPGP